MAQEVSFDHRKPIEAEVGLILSADGFWGLLTHSYCPTTVLRNSNSIAQVSALISGPYSSSNLFCSFQFPPELRRRAIFVFVIIKIIFAEQGNQFQLYNNPCQFPTILPLQLYSKFSQSFCQCQEIFLLPSTCIVVISLSSTIQNNVFQHSPNFANDVDITS